MLENEDLLDDDGIGQDQLILDMIRWWEKRRLLYNVIVGAFGLSGILIILNRYHSVSFLQLLQYAALPYGIFANIAYLAGWVLDLLLRYYLNIKLNVSSRQTLFFLGVGISILPLIAIIMIV